MKFVLGLFIFKLIKSDCLTSEQLTSLGLTAATQNINATSTLCTKYFTTIGTCVDPTTLNTKLTTDVNNLRTQMAIVNSLSSVLDVIISGLSKISSTSSSATETQINTDIGYIKGNSTSHYAACYNTLALLQMGTTCLLSTPIASANVVSGAGSLNVNFNTGLNGQQLETDCLPVFDGICTIISGKSLLYSSIAGTIPTVSNLNTAYANACLALTPYNNCNGDATCITTRRNLLISSLIQPYNYSLFPDMGVINNLVGYFSGIIGSIRTFFNFRLLTTTYVVNFTAGSSGEDLNDSGLKSGVTVPAPLSCNILGSFLAIVLFLLNFV